MKSNSEAKLNTCLDSIPPESERVVLALSGGIDSCVLLHLLSLYPKPFKLLLWHINHGLQDIAAEMEAFCRKLAQVYQLDLEVSHLRLDPDSGNLEAVARKARYRLFEQELVPGDCLLTAHHAEDQAETLLLNLMRGSGSAGLRGIAYRRPIGKSLLIRPLLDISRADIGEYAVAQGLDWYDDPSNQFVRFNRNYLRHRVIPEIRNRWPGYLESIRSVVSIQAENQQMLTDLAKQDYRQVRHRERESDGDLLDCEALRRLSEPRQKNLIRYWLNQQHCPGLPQSRLNELVRQLSVVAAKPVVAHGDYSIRVYNQQLFLVATQDPKPLEAEYDLAHAARINISGLDLVLERASIFEHLDLADEGQMLKVRFRTGKTGSSPDSHRLKRLFQKHKIPPWKRSLTPQIYLDENLAGLWF